MNRIAGDMRWKILLLILLIGVVSGNYSVFATNTVRIESLGLTEEEQQYLLTHNTFYYSIETNYPPIEYLDEKDQPKGIGVEYLKMASEILGVEFKLIDNVEILTWQENLELIKNKKIDLLPTASSTSERLEFMTFTQPYYIEEQLVIGFQGEPIILSIEELEGKKLCFTKGHWQVEYCKENFKNVDIVEVSTVRDALETVNEGKAQYILLDKNVFLYYMKSEQYKNLYSAGSVDLKAEHSIGVSNDQVMLKHILEKVIRQIPVENIIRDVFYNEQKTPATVKFILFGAVCFVGMVIALWLYIRNNRDTLRYKFRMKASRHALIENLSHDLKTPLAILKANLGLLKKGIIPESDRLSYYEKLDNSIDHMNHIIGELNDLSMISEDENMEKMKNVSINIWLSGVYQDYGEMFRNSDVVLVLKDNLDVNSNVKVCIEEKRMARALGNVLINALRFSPKNETVILSCIIEQKSVGISVVDKGSGVHPSEKDLIFERFYQSEHDRLKPGKGLGLAITKDIVKHHGGYIEVASKAYVETCFTLWLPKVNLSNEEQPLL